MAIDFLVVGGGIGGAVAANLLGRQGKRVLVIEKQLGRPTVVRPELLWPATIEILMKLIGESQSHWRLPLAGLTMTRGSETVLTVGSEAFERSGVQPYSTDPSQTREHLLQTGAFELRRGTEVVGVLKEKDRIAGVRARDTVTGQEHEIVADWTIADDGAHSVVRAACGIAMKTRIFPLDFLAFGFEWPADFAAGVIRLFWDKHFRTSGIFAGGAFPLPENKGAGLILARAHTVDDVATLPERWRAFSEQNPAINQMVGARRIPEDVIRIRRPWGHAERYGGNGAVLLGDAIHPVSPAGGQGANMSVADAAVVAELAVRGGADWVEEYERRRRPANERSMNITRRVAQVLSLPDFLIALGLPWFLRWVNRRPEERFARVLPLVSTAFQESDAERPAPPRDS